MQVNDAKRVVFVPFVASLPQLLKRSCLCGTSQSSLICNHRHSSSLHVLFSLATDWYPDCLVWFTISEQGSFEGRDIAAVAKLETRLWRRTGTRRTRNCGENISKYSWKHLQWTCHVLRATVSFCVLLRLIFILHCLICFLFRRRRRFSRLVVLRPTVLSPCLCPSLDLLFCFVLFCECSMWLWTCLIASWTCHVWFASWNVYVDIPLFASGNDNVCVLCVSQSWNAWFPLYRDPIVRTLFDVHRCTDKMFVSSLIRCTLYIWNFPDYFMGISCTELQVFLRAGVGNLRPECLSCFCFPDHFSCMCACVYIPGHGYM